MERRRRDYQEECRNSLRAAVAEGSNKNLIVSPTGSGKGTMIADTPEALGQQAGEQMLVTVHRKELVTQLAQKLREWNPDLKVDVERAQFRADKSNADVIVASVQSIGGSSRKVEQGFDDYNDRLCQFDPEKVRHVLIDECHRAAKTGSDYHRILRYFNLYKPDFLYDDPSKTLTCLTATPGRADNIGMETIVDKMVFSRDLETMMRTGLDVRGELRPWLATPRAFRIDTEVDLSNVSTRQGDFVTSELEKTVNTPARNKLIVEKYRELGEGMGFFAFTVDIQHSTDLANEFQLAGVKAYAVSGSTPDRDRKRLLDAFNAGQIDGLISCAVLSEGVDVPRAAVGLMARPTKSSLLYRQQAGRVFRPYPSPEQYAAGWTGWQKPYAIIIDFCDISGKHVLNALPSLFGLRPDFQMKGKKALDVVDEIEKAKKDAPGINLTLYDSVDKVRGAVIEVNLFPKLRIPDEVKAVSKVAWVTGVSVGTYQVTFQDTMLTVRQDTLGAYETFRHVKGVRTSLGKSPDLGGALKMAEREIPSESAILLKADAKWRFGPATDPQIASFARLYPEIRKLYKSDQEFAEVIRKEYQCGELSDKISQRAKPRANRPNWSGKPNFAGTRGQLR